MTRQQIVDIQGALQRQGWGIEEDDGTITPLEIDGLWGPNTEACLIAFQEEHGLDPDGIPGPLTLAALLPNDARDPKAGEKMPDYDFSTKEGTISAIVDECIRQGLTLNTQIAYVLGTVEWETGRSFRPIPERGTDSYLSRYEGRRDLGNYYYGDGIKFRGRGFIQITGRKNYQRYSEILGLDLIAVPELALVPANAVIILCHGMANGIFTGAKLSTYINENRTDYINARRVVNGLDRAQEIAALARKWEQTLEE